MKNINSIFDDKNYNEKLNQRIWDIYCRVVETPKEKQLDMIAALKIIASLDIQDDKLIKESSINFLGFLEGEDTTNSDDFIRLILKNSIMMYTLGKIEYLKYLKNINGIEEVEIYDEHVKIYLSNGKKIIFSSLSQYLDNYSTITEEEKKELESNQRLNDCHKGSIFTSMWSPDKNEVVTGYADSFGQYLHSWVEAKILSKEVVMDYTLNAIMNKDGYYYMNGVNKIINRIPDKTIQQDVENKVFSYMEKFDLTDTEYVVFRDELLKEIKRILENEGR